MSFVSFSFLALFLPAVFFLYLISEKSVSLQNVILLIASAVFYGCYNVKYLYILAAGIILTYLCGILGDCTITPRGKKRILLIGVVCNLMMLIVFKYTGFISENLSPLFERMNVEKAFPQLILPVGLSFFVFQSCSYLIDIYYGKINAEKNIITVALFVSFFPTITSGPIQRGKYFLPQLQNKRRIIFAQVQASILTFLWGAFIKMVIADRIALFTNHVWENLSNYLNIPTLRSQVSGV